jgi:hypothetical protein
MSIQGTSSTSFWQQDQNYWQQTQSQAQSSSAENSLISDLATLQTNLSNGMAQIATAAAQTRVNNQIAADEKALAAASGSSSTSSSSSTPTGPAPATAIGKVPLSATAPLSTLGIPPNSAITVSDGTNTTKYTTTGTDNVTDLIGAINANVAGNAYVTAALNSSGKLVITGKNQKESITIGGTFASDIGFGAGNQNFSPTAGSPSSSSSSTSSGSSTASSSSATGSSSKSASVPLSAARAAGVAALLAANTNSGTSLLSASGVAGSLVNMLA